MPNIQSAIKELRKSLTRQKRNKKIKDNFRNLIKKSQKAVAAKEAGAKDLVMKTLKALDKAAKKGVIKKNTRDRKKSNLHKKLNQILKV